MARISLPLMILLSVFISCSSDDDDRHDEPNWVRHVQPQHCPPQKQDVRLTLQRPPFVHDAS